MVPLEYAAITAAPPLSCDEVMFTAMADSAVADHHTWRPRLSKSRTPCVVAKANRVPSSEIARPCEDSALLRESTFPLKRGEVESFQSLRASPAASVRGSVNCG